MIDDSNDETNFPHKLLLTDTQVSIHRKAIANNSSANTKLWKIELSKMVQSGGFLGRPLGPLLKTSLPLMNNVLTPLAKSVIMPLGLTTAASATDEAIQNKYFGSRMIRLIISNEVPKDILEIVKYLE